MINDKQAKSQMEWKKRVQLLRLAIDKSLLAADKDLDARIRLFIDRVGALEIYRGHEEKNNLWFKRLDKARCAITTPQKLEGEVILEWRRKNLFHARGGEVITDEINLANSHALEEAQELMEDKGEKIVKEIKAILDRYLPPEEEVEFPLGRYLINRHPDRFLIRNEETRNFIVNDSGFTSFATSSDKVRFQVLPSYLEHYLKQNSIKIENELSEDETKILTSTKKLLEVYGEADKKGLVTYEGHTSLCFSTMGDDVQISRRDGSGLIFDNNGFSENANENDKRNLGLVEVFLQYQKHLSQHDNYLEQDYEKQRQADWEL